MNDSAARSDGARMGMSAMLRHSHLTGMQLRWIAYAKPNANGTVRNVVRVAKASVLPAERSKAGAAKYVAKLARPTNVPDLSSTARMKLRTRARVRTTK